VRATLEYSVGDCLADPRRLDVSIEVDVVDGGDSSPSPDAGVQAQAQNGDLILTLSSRRSIWTTENAIEVVATLSYVGDLDMVDLRGGGGPIVFSLRQLSGGNAVLGGGQDQPCLSYPIGPRSPRVWPFIKAGTVAEFGPFDRAFFDDPDLRLPPGRWEVRAWLVYGIDECGDLSLAASIELEVVAAANVDCHVSTADCDLAIGAASRLLQEGDSSPLHVVVTSGRGLVWHAEVHACWDDGQYLLIDVIGSVGVDRPTSDEVAATVRQDAWDDPPCD
jgi:hypothetical protein